MHVLRNAFLKPGHRHQDLEGRAGRELRLDGLVHQRMVGIGDQLVPVGAVDLDGKFVGVEAGPRNHRQNLAVPRVHGNDRAVAVAQREFGGALQIVVDRELQILPRHGVLDAEVAHLASAAVDDHLSRAVLPAQQFVVGLFHACLAHHVARLIVGKARVVQIVLAHLAHVADQMRGKTVARIQPALLVDGLQLRQLVTMRRDKCLLVGSHVLFDGDRLIAGLGAITVQRGAQLIEIEIQPMGDQRQIRIHIAALLAHQEAGDRRVIVDDKPVLAVEEFAARRQNRLLANAILLGQHAVAVYVQHLQTPQAGSQAEHHQKNAVLHKRQFDCGKLFAAAAD